MALRAWINIYKAPLPSYYDQQDKLESIGYIGERVRHRQWRIASLPAVVVKSLKLMEDFESNRKYL